MGHATSIKQADAKVAARLLRFIGQDEAWLFEERLERGLAWLRHHYGAGTVRERLAESSLFWAWWNNAWAGRDAILSNRLTVLKCGTLQYKVNNVPSATFSRPADFRPLYLAHHEPERLDISLDSEVLNQIMRRLNNAA